MTIEHIIKTFVKSYGKNNNTQTRWKNPIVKVTSASNPRFNELKESVRESHLLPLDLLPEAKSVIVYFLPFEEKIPKSNIKDYYVSEEWAVAYIETNTLIAELNKHLQAYFEGNHYSVCSVPATHNFDEETLMSDWSHRHIAEIAGLGKFGLNNMLITEAGCCGRVGSVVTSAVLDVDEVINEEACLYFKDGSCGVCVNKCPKDAFTEEGYNRFKCYEMCLENDKHHKVLGLVDVCGKCCVALPCSFKNPCSKGQ